VQGERLCRVLNGKYLKKYYPNMQRFEDIIADTLSQISPLVEDLTDMFFGHCPEQ
jgi:hypothetical protein